MRYPVIIGAPEYSSTSGLRANPCFGMLNSSGYSQLSLSEDNLIEESMKFLHPCKNGYFIHELTEQVMM